MEVPSPASGYVRHIAATDVGLVSMRLGGGRATKDSTIDYGVGIVLHKKVDEPVAAGGVARDDPRRRRGGRAHGGRGAHRVLHNHPGCAPGSAVYQGDYSLTEHKRSRSSRSGIFLCIGYG